MLQKDSKFEESIAYLYSLTIIIKTLMSPPVTISMPENERKTDMNIE